MPMSAGEDGLRTSAASFKAAKEDLAHLANLSISDERVRRACHHVGSDRIEEHRQLQEAFQCKPLPEQIEGKADIESPEDRLRHGRRWSLSTLGSQC